MIATIFFLVFIIALELFLLWRCPVIHHQKGNPEKNHLVLLA